MQFNLLRYILLILFLPLTPPLLKAQIKKAERYYNNYQYAKSIKYFKKAINNSDHKEHLYHLADTYFHLKDYKNAQLYFKRYVTEAPKKNTTVTIYDTIIVNNKKEIQSKTITEAHPQKTAAYLYLGECLMSNHQYQEAKIYFDLYSRTNPNDKRGFLFSKACDDIQVWATLPAKYEIYKIPSLNSKFSEFSAVEYKDNLVFVSDRREDILNENTDGYSQTPFLNMMITHLKDNKDSLSFIKARDFLLKFKGDYHTGPACFNSNFTEIFISRVDEFKNKKNTQNLIHKPRLYIATYTNGKWTNLTPFLYNNDSIAIAHPSLSSDNQYLFFTSDMPGGYGGTDIWYCKRQNQSWSLPINAGPIINTNGNESFPFISNNNTLYFSSDGHPGLGGLDIFSSVFFNETFTAPINLKAHINSPYDDFAIYFKSNNKSGYFSSNRTGGFGKDDIYGFTVNENVVNITGKILLSENIKDGAENVKILLLTPEGKIIQTTTTDQSGYFKFENIQADQYYLVKVDETDPLLQKQKKLYLADETNRIVKVTVISDQGYFTFENIPADLTQLNELALDDYTLKSRILNGFILNGKDSTALKGIKIFLTTENGEILQSRISDATGYFSFNNILADKNYVISIDEANSELQKINSIIVKDRIGRIILTINKNEQNKFTFQLLKNDQSNLALLDEEDPTINRSFSGKLYNAEDNSAIPGAKIILKNQLNEILQTTYTDNVGSFRFFNIYTQQNLKITTDPNDPSLANVKRIRITDKDGHTLYYAERKKDGFTFELLKTDPTFLNILEMPEPPITRKQISGKLLGDNKTPIVGAEVLMKDEKGNVIGRTLTDAKGNFKFINLPPDNNFLISLNENDPTLQPFNTITIFDRKGKELFKGGKFIGKFSFTVLTNDPAYLSLITEVPDATIKKKLSGKLINGNGSNDPIANAEIWLLNKQGDLIAKTKTDAAGNFIFKNINADENLLVTINPEDPTIKTLSRIILKDSKGNELLVSKKDETGKFTFNILATDQQLLSTMEVADQSLPRTLTGFIIAGDKDNLPIAGITLNLVNDNGLLVAKTTSQTNGKFRFTHLRPDENYYITINENDPALKKYNNIILVDKNGKILYTAQKAKQGFKFNLLKTDAAALSLIEENDGRLPYELKGYLINETTNLPVAGAKVILVNTKNQPLNETLTKQNGFFRFTNIQPDSNYSLTLNENDPVLKNIQKLIIKDAIGNVILVSDKKGINNFKFDLLASDATLLTLLNEDDTRIKINIEGLLLTDEKTKTPIPNVEVQLFSGEHLPIATTTTNTNGYFKFKEQPADQNFLIEVNQNSKALSNVSSFLLADKNGKTLKKIMVSKDGKFYFEILQADQFALASIADEETPLFLKNKKIEQPIINQSKSTKQEKQPPSFNSEKELQTGKILQTIYFAYSKAELTPQQKTQLKETARQLNQNPTSKIIINGYADSRGKTSYNRKLSEWRRWEVIYYLNKQGVSFNRISGKAYGEELLENECYDGVECSEEQHAENRKVVIIQPVTEK